ncbi:MAG: hypothetical protein QNL61_06680 [Crocinitomicaceae bacterium]
MQPILMNMIENKIKSAKFKLSQHKVQGANSTLSIFQVASLMDLVKGEKSAEGQIYKNRFLLN